MRHLKIVNDIKKYNDECGCSHIDGHAHKTHNHTHGKGCGCGDECGRVENKEISEDGMRLKMHGLNCTNCANEIERLVNKVDGVDMAVYNFSSKTLNIVLMETVNKTEEIFENVVKIVNKLEPDVVVEDISKANKAKFKQIDQNEIKRAFKKKWIATIIGATVFVITLFIPVSHPVSIGLFLTAYLCIGYDILLTAMRNILSGRLFDENFLMALASVVAFCMGEYEEAVAVMLFYKVGESFQDSQVDKARNQISSLLQIKANVANLVDGVQVKVVDPESVKVGQTIRISAGEKVPLDGVIISGKSKVDTSALTGESLLAVLKEGDEILSGMMVTDSSLTVKVTKRFEDSEVAKILELVENAAANKSKTEKFITKFAHVYTPIVVGLATLLAIVPPIILAQPFAVWVQRALVFLVASCPCALVISIPLGYFAGLGTSSKYGILIKGANYLEELSNIEAIVFDKTGTLTKGEFKVLDIQTIIEKQKAIEYFAASEQFSNHPLATAIKKSLGVTVDQNLLSNYKEIAGMGVSVNYKGDVILAGNDKLMKKYSVKGFINPKSNYTNICFAVNGEYIGYVLLGDEIKESSYTLVKSLKAQGIKAITMLTGDKKAIAEEVAEKLGIDQLYAELLPQDKLTHIEAIKSSHSVAFVGDGINDAPVLVGANVGFAMGAMGSDAAVEAADIVIMNDDPSKVVTAIKIAKRTKRIIKQNIIFSLLIKAIVLAMGAFGIANMWMAVFADVGVAILALFNAMRVNTRKE